MSFLSVLFCFDISRLWWVFVALLRPSLAAGTVGYSSLWCVGFSLRRLFLLQSTGSRSREFSSGITRAQQVWCTGLAASQYVESSQTRDQTHVPGTGMPGTVPAGKSLKF